nr:site-specific DNA-methyltransferase [uncultured Carboxylicivirga sp.]
MPTLNWIGKDKVINHHMNVPYKILDHVYGFDNGEQAQKETNSGNKIIHGDNLEALKALLPEYEGKIKCIYIDPPYNTGNEGWVYNDNVNDPKIKKWLGEVVGKESEDLTRHDKWLCMMYPRLKLLHKLLSGDGFIAVSIDDNELYNLGLLLNEIFGVSKRLACIPVKAEPSGGKGKEALRTGHEYLLIYYKTNTNGLKYETKDVEGTVQKDNWGEFVKGRELSKWGSESLREDREEMWYPLIAPDGTKVYPIRNDGKEGRWRWGQKNSNILQILKDPNYAVWEKRKYDEGVLVNGESERWFPYEKVREKEKSFGWNTWLDKIGFNSVGTKQIKEIFTEKVFDTPKPIELIEWVINLMDDDDGVVLDSFVGSGSTAHAVLSLNAKDGGNRKFILIEMEDYAENITAERVKRVIKGYGEDGKNVVGTGGSFDYYQLGRPLFLDNDMLNEEVSLEKIREYVWFSETRQPYKAVNQKEEHLLGVSNSSAYYFYYYKNELTTLDDSFLRRMKTKAEQYIIYADNCVLDDSLMQKYHITFKKIPRDITRF